MIKLLRAGFFRLKKEAIFWSFILITIVGAGYRIVRSVHDVPLDSVLYDYIMVIGFCIALFVSVFVGKEHSEGIIRNKIIAGHSRISIYLSNLIISIVTSVLCEFIYIAFMFLIGSHVYEKFQMSISQLCMILLNVVLNITAYCSIFNLISMICSEATTSVIVCVITFILMWVALIGVQKVADSPKYLTSTIWEYDDPTPTTINQGPNPDYPGDDKVKLAKVIELMIPVGQSQQLTRQVFTQPELVEIFHTKEEIAEEVNTLYQMPIYSIILISIVNVIGLWLFSKKELK